MIFAFFVALLGGALFWWRGSARFAEWLGRGKTTADAVFALGAGIVAHLAATDEPIWLGAAVAGGFWLGLRPGWWGSLSLGRNPLEGISVGQQWLRHTVRGMVFIIVPAFVVCVAGYEMWPLLFAGLLCAPLYEVGWRVRETVPASIEFDGTEVGESLFGAAMFLMLAVSVA